MKLLQLVNRKTIMLAIFFSLLTGLDTLVIPVIVNTIIDSVQRANVTGLYYATGYGILGYIFLQLNLFLWRKFLAKINCEFSQKAKLRVFKYATRVDLSSEETENMIYNDIPLVEQQYIKSFLNLVYCLWFSMVSLVYVLYLSWQVSLLFVAFSAIPIFLPRFFERKLKDSNAKWSASNEVFIKELNDSLAGMSVMKHYGCLPILINRFLTSLKNRENHAYEKDETSYKVTFIINVFAVVTGILPFGLGGVLALKGYLSVGALIAVFLASDRVLSPLENAINHWNAMKASSAIVEKLESIVLTDEDVTAFSKKDKKAPTLKLSFKEVAFGYDKTLFHLNTELGQGQKVLITGESGAGKTTIFKTLFREINTLSGELLLNDRPIESLDKAYLYNHLGYIPQDIIIFDDSLGFNVTLGEDFGEEAILSALEKAGLSKLVEAKGLDYQVGHQGQGLSGGEKARLVVARALLRDYSVLLVDEFSSALDRQTAQKIRKLLLETNATVLEIAHHYSKEEECQYDQVWTL